MHKWLRCTLPDQLRCTLPESLQKVHGSPGRSYGQPKACSHAYLSMSSFHAMPKGATAAIIAFCIHGRFDAMRVVLLAPAEVGRQAFPLHGYEEVPWSYHVIHGFVASLRSCNNVHWDNELPSRHPRFLPAGSCMGHPSYPAHLQYSVCAHLQGR